VKMLVAARSGQRALIFGLAIASLCLASTHALAAFDLDDVAKRAHELASKDFEDRSRSIPQWLLEINYDQWRDIRFRPDQSHWRSAGLPFELQFFHCGLFYDRSVKMNEIDAEGVRPIPFSPNLFDYGKNEFGSRIPQDLGFAGFRVHYPINKRKIFTSECRRAGSQWTPRCRRVRSFRTSASSGSCVRPRRRRISSSTRSSTANA
jgi:glucans biosynthesis protein